MSKFIITADSEDQNWLDAFNRWAGHTYSMNQEVNDDHLDEVKRLFPELVDTVEKAEE